MEVGDFLRYPGLSYIGLTCPNIWDIFSHAGCAVFIESASWLSVCLSVLLDYVDIHLLILIVNYGSKSAFLFNEQVH